MKYFISFLILTFTLFGWETTTHRAIDRKAIEKSENLQEFIKNSRIDKSYKFIQEEFSGYGTTTYEKYISGGENNGISNWNQTFSGDNNIWDAIEAGTMLEDAQWSGWKSLGGNNGRYVNHFADPQRGYIGLWGAATNALQWAESSGKNTYDHEDALKYFKLGFASITAKERKRYQAKMLVSVGHIMHLMNDMNVPAHTRNDGHPMGDSLEWWARGGTKCQRS